MKELNQSFVEGEIQKQEYQSSVGNSNNSVVGFDKKTIKNNNVDKNTLDDSITDDDFLLLDPKQHQPKNIDNIDKINKPREFYISSLQNNIINQMCRLPDLADYKSYRNPDRFGLSNYLDRYGRSLLGDYFINNPYLTDDPYWYPTTEPYSYYGAYDSNKAVDKSQAYIVLNTVVEEVNEMLTAIFERAEGNVNVSIEDHRQRQEISVQQLVERIHRYKQILESDRPTSPWTNYLILNDHLARLADTNPELYSKFSDNLQKLGAEIVENEGLRTELINRLGEEERVLLLSMLYSTAKRSEEIEKINEAAELTGLQPTQVFEDFPYVTQTPIDEQTTKLSEDKIEERKTLEDTSNNIEEIKAVLEDIYMNNPYAAHILDAIAVRYIATGKLNLPEENIPVGLHLIKNLDKLDEEQRKELFDSLERFGISQLTDPRKRIEEAMEEREQILNKLREDQSPESKEILMKLMGK